MNPHDEAVHVETRRQLLGRSAYGIGALALNALGATDSNIASGLPHFAAKAKRIIYLHMVGAPPQMD